MQQEKNIICNGFSINSFNNTSENFESLLQHSLVNNAWKHPVNIKNYFNETLILKNNRDAVVFILSFGIENFFNSIYEESFLTLKDNKVLSSNSEESGCERMETEVLEFRDKIQHSDSNDDKEMDYSVCKKDFSEKINDTNILKDYLCTSKSYKNKCGSASCKYKRKVCPCRKCVLKSKLICCSCKINRKTQYYSENKENFNITEEKIVSSKFSLKSKNENNFNLRNEINIVNEESKKINGNSNESLKDHSNTSKQFSKTKNSFKDKKSDQSLNVFQMLLKYFETFYAPSYYREHDVCKLIKELYEFDDPINKNSTIDINKLMKQYAKVILFVRNMSL